MTVIRSEVHSWGFREKREYISFTMPFGQAKEVFKCDPFKASKNTGEQRGIVNKHANKLKKAMETDSFTPCCIHVGIRKEHMNMLNIEQDGMACCTIPDGVTLPITNGGHRFESLSRIIRGFEDVIKKATTQEEKQAAQASIDTVNQQPVTCILMLNGNTQDDFINLQLGKTVDGAHNLSINVLRQHLGKDGAVTTLGFKIANLLATNRDSAFQRNIRFDSVGHAGYPISTLCSKGVSDRMTSLLGLATLGIEHEKDAKWLAWNVIVACAVLKKEAPELVAERHLLTLPPDGVRGAATMLIGLGICLAYRTILVGGDLPGPNDTNAMIEAAKKTLSGETHSNFSGQGKRKLIGEFTKAFFSDLGVEKHEEVPIGLLKMFIPSSFGVSKLPKPKKVKDSNAPKGRRSRKAATQTKPANWQEIDPNHVVEPEPASPVEVQS